MRRISALANHLKDEDPSRPITAEEFDEEKVGWAFIAGSMNLMPKVYQDRVNFSENCLCLCDGHGDYGEYVSELVCAAISGISQVDDEKLLADFVQKEIVEHLGREVTTYSGCTGVWIRRLDSIIRVANVGDSRCFAVDAEWRVVFETRDHKPDDPDELARITALGGVVTKRMGGVARVAGLALSRAFGDFAISSHGVNAIPDITEIPKEMVRFVFVASDGVFDMMDNDEICSFLKKSDLKPGSIKSCLKSLVKLCKTRWEDDTEHSYCDDISCAVWFI